MGWKMWFSCEITVGFPLFYPRTDLDHPSPKLQRPAQWAERTIIYPLQAGRARRDARNSWAERGFAPFLKLTNQYVSPLERSLCSFFFFLSRIDKYLYYMNKEKALFFIILYSCGTQWGASCVLYLYVIDYSWTKYFRLMEPKFSFFPIEYRGNENLGVYL